MRFENTEVTNFDGALRGMRNPMESWGKSDSKWDSEHRTYCIGENDMKLAQKLIKAGSEHRKFMRQIFVSVDITAPLYWWKEFDTYKVGTVANSTSTMHKLASTPITEECFEMDDYEPLAPIEMYEGEIEVSRDVVDVWNDLIKDMEKLRQKYLATQDKRYWKELIRLLPESFLQTRTVTMDYENLLAMCSKGQRRYHKLNEWSGIDHPEFANFISWARNLPYAKEFLFLDECEENGEV